MTLPKPRKTQDEKDLEQLAQRLLSIPHKLREESKIGKRKPARKPDAEASKRQR